MFQNILHSEDISIKKFQREYYISSYTKILLRWFFNYIGSWLIIVQYKKIWITTHSKKTPDTEKVVVFK